MTDEAPAPTAMTKSDVLQSAIGGREQEVMHYDINITNYELAIEEIEAGPHDDPDVETSNQEFKKRLVDLIKTEKRERAKAQLILNAVRRQLADNGD